MAITLFQPEVWSATLLSILEKSLVYAGAPCVNRNYEGEISAFGDTVHIDSIADPAISTYTKDTDLASPQALTDAEQLLLIDQAKVFNFAIDDIDLRQTRSGGALMTEAASRAAFGLRDVTDQYVGGLMKAGAAVGVAGVTTVSVVTDAYDKILVPLSIALDVANVPNEGRFVVVPPAFYGKLMLDGRFIKVNESGSATGLRNGNVGDAAGFTILKSNNTPAGSTTGRFIIAGSNIATTYAEQISKVEAYRPEKRFGDALKGLHLYGAKVLRPTALASADVIVA
jgi:hypothetical protein